MQIEAALDAGTLREDAVQIAQEIATDPETETPEDRETQMRWLLECVFRLGQKFSQNDSRNDC